MSKQRMGAAAAKTTAPARCELLPCCSNPFRQRLLVFLAFLSMLWEVHVYPVTIFPILLNHNKPSAHQGRHPLPGSDVNPMHVSFQISCFLSLELSTCDSRNPLLIRGIAGQITDHRSLLGGARCAEEEEDSARALPWPGAKRIKGPRPKSGIDKEGRPRPWHRNG